jgi:fatty-acyl-CoA synthase
MEFDLASVSEAIAAAIPERECIVHGSRRLRYADVARRTRRLAAWLKGRGLGVHRERAGLRGWESGQDHLALYLYNCPEYLEGMLGAFKARVAPLNVNYRYVDDELVYLLRDSSARALVFGGSFAANVARIRRSLPELRVLVQVNDGSGHDLLEGAVAYESIVGDDAAADVEPGSVHGSPDDLYILYTGGTTGMPKGVLWRQADIFVTALGGQTQSQSGVEFDSVEAIVERAAVGHAALRVLPSPPFMHGAAHWSALHTMHMGGTVVLQEDTHRLDARDLWATVERERVQALLIVGDAFARPLLDALAAEPRRWDLSGLTLLVTGGAALTAALKHEMLAHLPQLVVLDAVGSSETGSQAQHMSSRAAGVSTGTFVASPNNVVLDDTLTREVPPGSPEAGWLARRGRVPLGYLGDPDKTRRTFPVAGGVRFSVPGDRARVRPDGTVELLGRDSVTINTGGEKVFAEEVEQALKHHPAVYDAVVVGRPSERWGQEVVAVVRLRDGASATEEELLTECGKHLARYKLPKAFVFRDEIVRSPSGKADYRWAKSQVGG